LADALRLVERVDEADANHHRLGDIAPPGNASNVKPQGLPDRPGHAWELREFCLCARWNCHSILDVVLSSSELGSALGKELYRYVGGCCDWQVLALVDCSICRDANGGFPKAAQVQKAFGMSTIPGISHSVIRHFTSQRRYDETKILPCGTRGRSRPYRNRVR
jgi:hypothetical protein